MATTPYRGVTLVPFVLTLIFISVSNIVNSISNINISLINIFISMSNIFISNRNIYDVVSMSNILISIRIKSTYFLFKVEDSALMECTNFKSTIEKT